MRKIPSPELRHRLIFLPARPHVPRLHYGKQDGKPQSEGNKKEMEIGGDCELHRESMVTSILTSPFGLLIPPGQPCEVFPGQALLDILSQIHPYRVDRATIASAAAALSTAHTLRADVPWTAPITSRRLICAGGRASLKPPAAPLTDLRMPFFASTWSIFRQEGARREHGVREYGRADRAVRALSTKRARTSQRNPLFSSLA